MSGTVSSRIVVGVDGSPESTAAAVWAAAEARRRHADLLLLTAVAPYPAGLPGVAAQVDRDVAGREGTHGLNETVTQRMRRRFPEVRITGAFQERDPRTALVDASRSALLTVVGNPGSGRWPQVLTGSVALYVASHAHSPVAVIPGEGEPASGPVLIGVDPRGTSQAAIDLAFDEAARRGADLVAVLAGDRVVAHQGFARRPVRPLPVELDQDRALLSEQLSGWPEKYPDVTVHQMLLNGRPARCLAHFAEITGVDRPQLTVVGSRGHGSLAGLVLGSTSHDLLAAGTGPVLVVPAGP